MKIASEIRAIEAHVKSISDDKALQLRILSESQRMLRGLGDEYQMAILIVAKNRIRKS